MANIERFVRKTVNTLSQQLGLQPKQFPTKEEAETAAIKEFLETEGPHRILNLSSPTSPDVEKEKE